MKAITEAHLPLRREKMEDTEITEKKRDINLSFSVSSVSFVFSVVAFLG